MCSVLYYASCVYVYYHNTAPATSRTIPRGVLHPLSLWQLCCPREEFGLPLTVEGHVLETCQEVSPVVLASSRAKLSYIQ